MSRSVLRFVAAFACVAGMLAAGPQASAQTSAERKMMKLSSFTSPTHFLTPIVEQFAADLSAASNGEAEIDVFIAEALGKATEQWDVALEGLADMSLFCAIYTPSRFPLSMMVELPFFSGSAQVSSQVVSAFLAEGLLGEEFKEARLMSPITAAPSQIFATRPLQKVEDFRGLRITGNGPVWSRTWSILGAQNLSMGWPDIYLALERGTLDAGTTSWTASVGWKWQEVAESPIDISIMGGFFCGIAMNNDAWASLTPETQARWATLADDYALRFSKAYDDGDVDAKAIWKAAGRTITEFPADEKKRLAEALLPIWQDWVAENEAAGRPAKRMYQVYVETMKKLGEPVVMQLPGLY